MDLLERNAEEAEESGDLETAVTLWKELAGRSRDSVFFCRYGRVAEELERWGEAEIAFGEALRIDPSDSIALERMGELWLTRSDLDEMESLQAAAGWFLKALERGRNARTLTFLAATYLALGNVQTSRAALEEAIQLDPNYEEALYNLAKIERDVDEQKAARLLERAIQIDPSYSLAHQELGKVYQSAGDLLRAEYHLRRSLETDPTDYWTHLFLANLLAVQGKNEEARHTYRFATSLHPEIAVGKEFFARFLDAIGSNREAAQLRTGWTEVPGGGSGP